MCASLIAALSAFTFISQTQAKANDITPYWHLYKDDTTQNFSLIYDATPNPSGAYASGPITVTSQTYDSQGWTRASDVDIAKIKTFEINDELKGWQPTTLNLLFSSYQSSASTQVPLTATISGLENIDVSKCTSMLSAFWLCRGLTSDALQGTSAWDTGAVTNMSSVFRGCSSLTSLDGLSTWNTEDVSSMTQMFQGCSSLTSLDALFAWNVRKVQGDSCMESMFGGCSSLISLEGLSAWDVSSVEGNYCMAIMFSGCTKLTSIDAIKNWDASEAISSTNGVQYMFQNCSALTTLSLNPFKLNSSMQLPTGIWYKTDGTTVSNIYAQTDGLFARSDLGSNPFITMSTLSAMDWGDSLGYTGYITQNLPKTLTGTDTSGTSHTLSYGADYYIEYTKEQTNDDTRFLQDAGSYKEKICLTGRYLGSPATPGNPTVVVNPLSLSSDKVTVYTEPSEIAYTGSALTPKTMVRVDLSTSTTPGRFSLLKEKEEGKDTGDYTVSYANNIRPGNATATASGASTNVAGDKSVTFKIVGEPISENTGWVWEETGWRYYTEDGSYLSNGWEWVADDTYGAYWYYFFSDGFCAMRDWIWDGAWYYIQGDCAMACGTWNWIDGAWYGFNWDGTMCVGWIWDNDYHGWYYCYSNGIMARNTWVDSYWVDDSGRWIS